ncbi:MULTISPECIES: YqiA/YcfP family alpha/beta fold hydrolase [Shewanella]|uniref:Esterase YqiA n=1 Tax=Shewanella marisflavi TaxID=260364 RepID=A0AAC9TYV6_9GAMM|nr:MULTISPECIES: YqiA/YcfP family alpha/beta fold hydrolase [Shewanella]ASJ95566.1 esterase YqiA [Shewanella marisflavi]MCL1041538.1 esterase YqiA [Shewanella marisflavi]QDF74124.1 esterase YqiA [Shewanella marisflavi]
MLLYIHGFNSSPQSDKGVVTAQYIAKHFPQLKIIQPQLPATPEAAMEMLIDLVEQALAQGESLRFIGSSLGGYFASYLVERYGGRAVLVNPAVKPFELFDEFLGPQYNPYTDQAYQILPEHKLEVAKYDTPAIQHPDRFLVLLQSGDEVLDYRQAVNKYQCCQMLIEAGGDHSFVGYQQQMEGICRFLFLDK